VQGLVEYGINLDKNVLDNDANIRFFFLLCVLIASAFFCGVAGGNADEQTGEFHPLTHDKTAPLGSAPKVTMCRWDVDVG